MSRQPKPELFDYMVVAINPALIMVLICSLVYFLLEMFYQGHYPARLHFCLTAFIFAAVLVARISMEEGWEHAAPFGIALAVAISLAMHRFVSYEHTGVEAVGWIINYGLIALAWWCANKLTWDCTLIDETQDASGEGLLQTVGLDASPRTAETKADAARIVDKKSPTKEIESKKKSTGAAADKAFDDDLGWSTKKGFAADGKSRWQRFLDRRRRPHAPGVWVVYFSLAALPIFGVGQTFIPTENTASRRYAFVLLCVYVASAMGLLLTTSFLGLRRYLRQRRLEMPLTMAGTWLATGAILIFSLIALTVLLPRPNAEYQISALPTLGSEEHDASKTAAGREGTKDDQAESRTGAPRKSDNPDAKPSDREAGQHSGDQKSADSSAKSAPGEKSGDSQQDKSEGGGNASGAKSGKSADGESKGGNSIKSDSKSDSAGKSSDNSSQSEQPKSQPSPADQKSSQANEQQPAEQPSQSPPEEAPSFSVGSWAIDLLKWVFYGVVCVIALVWAWRHRAELVAWLAALFSGWGGLFGNKRDRSDAVAIPVRQKSFLEFTNPFASGDAGRYAPEELVRYSFEALEAWARDNGWPRTTDQTAFEFARQMGSKFEPLATPARRLAELYSSAAYSAGRLPPSSAEPLRSLWEAMSNRPLAGLDV
jgi:Domain of unknown function (DUF4129)